ncbi:SPOR domain-containing protein [Roseicyclus sp.]|uniref:SPOR domain-containing protein n=1 Tax=Roseicyclus sp. TaxID=1914329 RepID=UPI003F6AF6C1
MANIGSFGDDRGFGASDGHGASAPVMSQVGQIVNWAGAFVSLGLVVGMAVWAFQLASRDVSGVPVIRALEGPMRSAPEDPGGTQADHQGLAVNRLAEGAAAADVPDTLVLAPPPVELTAVAMSSASLAADIDQPSPTPEAASRQTQELIDVLMARGADTPLVENDDPIAAEMAGVSIAPQPAPPQGTTAPSGVIAASVPGVSLSIRPPVRPTTILASASMAEVAGPLGAAVRELDGAELAEGTRLVQLGAFDSPEIAQAEWDRLLVQFPDYFEGRARVIQSASSGGAAFYRLRAHGFEDLAASRRFCAALVARNAPCIPVTVR